MTSFSAAAGIGAEAGIISQRIPQWTAMIQLNQTARTARAPFALIAALAIGIGCPSVFAATIDDLYSVTVSRSLELAPGQAPRTLEDTIRFAMGQLLTRVTGRLDAALEPDLADLLENASDFVVQRGSLDRETLLVTFDARAIEAVLVARDQPIWGPERPLTLVWLAVDTGQGERGILSAGDVLTDASPEFLQLQADFRAEMATAEEERGLPLTLPLMDLEDMGALDFVDIWAGFNTQVTQASSRYGVDAMLTGRARQTPFGVNIQWVLLRDGEEFALTGTTLRDGLDRLADFYAAEFSTLGGVRSTLITVVGVETLDDYGRVMRHLEAVSLLDSVSPEELVDGALSLRVAARGGAAVLERVLGLSTMLTPIVEQTGQTVNEDRLTFTLNR
jgi:hypothetical protein